MSLYIIEESAISFPITVMEWCHEYNVMVWCHEYNVMG